LGEICLIRRCNGCDVELQEAPTLGYVYCSFCEVDRRNAAEFDESDLWDKWGVLPDISVQLICLSDSSICMGFQCEGKLVGRHYEDEFECGKCKQEHRWCPSCRGFYIGGDSDRCPNDG
jgi:hypothetical protein